VFFSALRFLRYLLLNFCGAVPWRPQACGRPPEPDRSTQAGKEICCLVLFADTEALEGELGVEFESLETESACGARIDVKRVGVVIRRTEVGTSATGVPSESRGAEPRTGGRARCVH
jgi:hypothetical protein